MKEKQLQTPEADNKVMSDILLAIVEWMKEIPKNKTFLEELKKKQGKRNHPPLP